MTIRIPFLAAIALAIAVPANAQGFQDIAAIDTSVAALTGKAIGQPGGARSKADPRLRLAACPVDPLAEWYGTGRANVKVSCPISGGWKVYVPLNAGASGSAVIARGDLVQLRVEGPGFSLSSRAEALEPGAEGDTISVRLMSADKRQVIRGHVVEPGVVGIVLP